MTSDTFTTIATLESALAAEKASHTDTLVKLRLTEERLAASEAERERLGERLRHSERATETYVERFGHAVVIDQSLRKLQEQRGAREGVMPSIEEVRDDMIDALETSMSVMGFLRENGNEIVSWLRADRSKQAEALADELDQLLLTLELEDDEPTEPMHPKVAT